MNALLNDPQFLGLRLAGILVVLAIFAVPSLPLISVVSQAIAKSQQKSFYDKFGKQITRMCLVFGGTALAVLVLAVARYLSIDPVILQGPDQLPILVTAGVTVLASVVSTVYFKVWKTMRKQKIAHMSIGLLSFFLSFSAVICMVLVANILQSIEHFLPSSGTPLEILAALVTAANSEAFFTFTSLGFIMGFALCGTFAQVYLLARRNKDDFGRDYYKFAMPYAAKWSFGGALLQLTASVVLLSKTHLPVLIEIMATSLLTELLENPIFMAWTFALVLPVIACLLWSCIVLCSTPMRRKISIYCAAILMLIADISLLLAAYMGILMTMAPPIVS